MPSESSHQLFLDVQFATWLKWYSFSSLIALTNWDLVPAPTYSAWGFSSLTRIFFRVMPCCAYSFSDSPCGAEIHQDLLSNRVSPHVLNSWPQFWGHTFETFSLEPSAYTLAVFLGYLLCHCFFHHSYYRASLRQSFNYHYFNTVIFIYGLLGGTCATESTSYKHLSSVTWCRHRSHKIFDWNILFSPDTNNTLNSLLV